MPPHCDSMDGPVVAGAGRALEAKDADIALAYGPKEGEEEVRHAFDAVIAVHDQGSAAHELADLHFFGPVVRMHRAGEGAPYTGLKPPGLDHGHVIPVAEHAIESGSPGELVSLLTGRVEHEVRSHFKQVMELKAPAEGDLDANRACVEAMFDLQAWSHSLYQTTKASAHEHDHVHAEWAMFRCACCGRRREGSIHIGTTDHTCVVGVPVLVSEGRT